MERDRERYTPEITKVKMCWKIPLKVHWGIPVKIHWASDNPVESPELDAAHVREQVLAKPRRATKEGQRVLRTPPAYQSPCFSLLGLILRTLVSF